MVIGSLLNALGLTLLLLGCRRDKFQRYLIAGSGLAFLAGVGSILINMGV